MLRRENNRIILEGPAGSLTAPEDDPVLVRFAMLYEGECEGLGATGAAAKFGMTRQRYYQLRAALAQGGSAALQPQKRGPKTNYRRTEEAVRQVIRHRFLDPDASPEVIAQKLRQVGFRISARTVERIIQDLGLQKKTL